MDKIIFGDPASFAISCEQVALYPLDELLIASGSFVFWVDDELIGNAKDTTIMLTSAAWYLAMFLKKYGHRESAYLQSMTSDQVFELVYKGFYYPDVFDELCEDQELSWGSLDKEYQVFSGGPVASFDGIGILLIETDYGYDRLIWKKSVWQHSREFLLPKPIFKEVCIEFFSWLEDLLRRDDKPWTKDI